MVVKVPGGRSVEAFHFEKAYHGHNLKLRADSSLLESFGGGVDERAARWLAAEAIEPPLTDPDSGSTFAGSMAPR